jgi:hypothetical protein
VLGVIVPVVDDKAAGPPDEGVMRPRNEDGAEGVSVEVGTDDGAVTGGREEAEDDVVLVGADTRPEKVFFGPFELVVIGAVLIGVRTFDVVLVPFFEDESQIVSCHATKFTKSGDCTVQVTEPLPPLAFPLPLVAVVVTSFRIGSIFSPH